MTHDPLCDAIDKLWAQEPDGSWRCMDCAFIAKVRADERNQAEARVETLRHSNGVITISAAAALAAGDTWTSQW